MTKKTRTEHDTMGKVEVPRGAYWGAQTQRAHNNYQISDFIFPASFIQAQLKVKEAAALANQKSGKLKPGYARPIIKAAREIRRNYADWEAQFTLDVYQAGAGTSQNMNVNEVIARRANQLLHMMSSKHAPIHPNDHVNMSQSTNDTIPSAMYIACYSQIHDTLLQQLEILQKSLKVKAKEFAPIKKTGRTHLQDATPLTLGDEFGAYVDALKYHLEQIKQAADGLLLLNLGGTAVGSGLNAGPQYSKHVYIELHKITSHRFKSNPNLFAGTQNFDALLSVSAALRNTAIAIGKIASDLRLLSSGPVSGIGEIILPPVQPGSSIMPGKVNPSILEMVNQVCFQVMGFDHSVALAGGAAQLELNYTMPLVSYNALHMIQILGNTAETMADKCIDGIKANKARAAYYLERNPVVATALAPVIGYEQADDIIKQAYKTGESIKDIVLDQNLLSEEECEKLIS